MNTTPRMVVNVLREMIRESGLKTVEFAAFSHVERRALWQICTSEDEKYLPNLGTCIAIAFAYARIKKPKSGHIRRKKQSEDIWAKDTLSKVEELTTLYEQAKRSSRRRSQGFGQGSHRRQPSTSITTTLPSSVLDNFLPDWIKGDSA